MAATAKCPYGPPNGGVMGRNGGAIPAAIAGGTNGGAADIIPGGTN